MFSSQPFTQSTSPIDANGIVRCKHGEAVVKKLSQTPTNFNREFYSCARFNQSEKCKFFYWADDPIFHQVNVSPAPSPSVTSPSQRQRATAAREMEIPQKSPNKRLVTEIQAALDSQESSSPLISMSQSNIVRQDATPAIGRTHSFLFGSSTQSSETSTDVDGEDVLPEVSGVEPSGPTTRPDYFSTGSSDFRTPKKPRISTEEPSSAHKSLLMTPPQTIRRGRAGTSSSQGTSRTEFPSTPTRNKGKARADDRREQSKEDETAAPTAGAIVPGSSESGGNAVRSVSPNPFLDDDTIADRISSHLDALNVLQAAPYIRKLERKFNALNLSNKSKAKCIEQLGAVKAKLENEITELKRQNTDLQARLQRSEQGKHSSGHAPSSSMNRPF